MATLPSECRKRKTSCISKRSERSGATKWITFPNGVSVAEPRSGSITERVPGTKACLHYRTSAGNKSLLVLPNECRKQKLACITERVQETKACLYYRTSAGNKSLLVLPNECRKQKLACITERVQETKACLYYRTSAGNKSLLVLPNECRKQKLACITERVQETKACLHYRTSAGNESLLALPSECRERKPACIYKRMPGTKACLHTFHSRLSYYITGLPVTRKASGWRLFPSLTVWLPLRQSLWNHQIEKNSQQCRQSYASHLEFETTTKGESNQATPDSNDQYDR